jgi:hypothetical protein
MHRRLWLVSVLLVPILFTSNAAGQPRAAAPTMRVHLIDVGQGAATLPYSRSIAYRPA